MKRKILLLQWPFSLGDESNLFNQLNFDIVCEHIISFDYLAEFIETVKDTLKECDFVVISILSSPDFANVTFPSEKIRQLKEAIGYIAVQNNKEISLIGMNICLDENLREEQHSQFEGKFIDNSTLEKIEQILS